MFSAIRLDALPGYGIEDMAYDACRLADKFGHAMVFKFNAVECWVRPGDTPTKVVQWYHEMSELLGKA